MSSNYCPRIFHGMSLHSLTDTSVDYSVCCLTSKTIFGPEIADDHPVIQNLRAANKQNLLPYDYCKTCIEQEASGNHSLRLGFAELHGEPTYDNSIQYLDINIDRTCNLACVSCGPASSTTWRNELRNAGQEYFKVQTRPQDLEQFIKKRFDKLDLSKLREINIYGGEPFLTNSHVAVLEYIVDLGIANQVRLHYNTNGTQRIKDSVKKLMEMFEFVRINFSIDAVGSQFEYIRYGAKWDSVQQTLLWWKNNLPHNSMLSITVTVSVLNALCLNELSKWKHEHFDKTIFGDPIEIISQPAHLTPVKLENMNTELQDYIKNFNYDPEWKWLKNSSLLAANAGNLEKLLNWLQVVDQRRNLNFALIDPVTSKLLGYSKK